MNSMYLLFEVCFLYGKYTKAHYVPPPKPCAMAQVCNHTGIAICGLEAKLITTRKFLDECDMYEYNCDNSKHYYQTNNKECEERVTTTTSTTVSSPFNITDTTTQSTTESTTPSTTESTTQSTTLSTTESTTQSTIESTTPSSTESTTARTTQSSPASTTQSTVASTTESTTVSTTVSTTIGSTESTTASRTTAATSQSMTTSITNLPLNTSCSFDAKTTTSVPPTAENIVTCQMYPEDCDRPVTWETTAKGETRDFYQILRERYGNRVKLLRATTHWPLRGIVYSYNEENFRFGRHNES